MSRVCVAVDIGAESGRVIRGEILNGRLSLKEVHRFPNVPVRVDGSLRWDIDDLLSQVRLGIFKAGSDIASVGVDTWGVDYVLLDEAGDRLGLPYHYRDARTNDVLVGMSRANIYRQTGIQFLPFNTLFQLLAEPCLGLAKTLLTIPDYLHYELTGRQRKVAEFTNATTTQCYDPRAQQWATELLDTLQIPTGVFPEVVQPGTVLGELPGTEIQVIAPATHDTGSAVVAVPAEGDDFAWISSGTWSVLGIERASPVISDESFKANFTNEGGAGDTFRLSKNVMGLWIVQQCRAAWDTYSYAELDLMAAEAVTQVGWIDPDDALFLPPGDMPNRVNQALRDLGHCQVEDPGQLIRIVYESLALKYRFVLERLRALTGQALPVIHIIGGGSQSRVLNQITADVCGCPVVAGPTEATAIGNLLIQLVSLGELPSIAAGRQLVRDSFPCETFLPQSSASWTSTYAQFKAHLESKDQR